MSFALYKCVNLLFLLALASSGIHIRPQRPNDVPTIQRKVGYTFSGTAKHSSPGIPKSTSTSTPQGSKTVIPFESLKEMNIRFIIQHTSSNKDTNEILKANGKDAFGAAFLNENIYVKQGGKEVYLGKRGDININSLPKTIPKNLGQFEAEYKEKQMIIANKQTHKYPDTYVKEPTTQDFLRQKKDNTVALIDGELASIDYVVYEYSRPTRSGKTINKKPAITYDSYELVEFKDGKALKKDKGHLDLGSVDTRTQGVYHTDGTVARDSEHHKIVDLISKCKPNVRSQKNKKSRNRKMKDKKAAKKIKNRPEKDECRQISQRRYSENYRNKMSNASRNRNTNVKLQKIRQRSFNFKLKIRRIISLKK